MPTLDDLFAPILADRLREARLTLNLTQEQLGQKVGLPHTQISHWETGLRQPSLINFRRLCKALDVNPHWLLGLKAASK